MKRPAVKLPDAASGLEEPEPEEKDKKGRTRSSKPLPVESAKEPPAKKQAKGEVISTEPCKSGWQILTHKTATGRAYKKWVAPGGKCFYSAVTAEAHGFEG